MPEPTYHDPFYKPRKASRLERLRYRVWLWAERAEEEWGPQPIGIIRDAKDGVARGWDDSFESRMTAWYLRRRNLLLAVALAMAGCGGVAAVWVVFGWGGG